MHRKKLGIDRSSRAFTGTPNTDGGVKTMPFATLSGPKIFRLY